MKQDGFEPKTIEDYKDIIKLLKSKVIKQTKYIKQLEGKVKDYQNQITESKKSTKFENVPMADGSIEFPNMTKDFDTQNLKNKSIVMYLFKKNAEKLGLNLEGIFRYADQYLEGELDCDEFRKILIKMNLMLTPKQISCLIYIFDEDCNGLITKNDYHNSLRAYVVSQQENSKHYNNDCLLRIAQLFSEKKIEAQSFFEQMKRSQKIVDINTFGDLIKKKFSRQLQERQIVGAFNQIDFESQGILQKDSFSYSMKAYIAKPRDRSRTPPPRSENKTQEKFYPHQESKFSNKKNDGNKSSPSKVEDFDIKPNQTNSDFIEETSKQVAPILFQMTKETKLTSQQIFTKILDHKFNTPITLNVFKRLLQQQSKQVNNKLALQLFKKIDREQKGSFDIAKVFQFYAQNQKDSSVLLHMIAKHFEAQEMDCSKFMYINSLNQDNTVNRKQFVDLFSSELGLQERFLDGLWNYFNKNGSDNVTVANIIKEIAIYQSQ